MPASEFNHVPGSPSAACEARSGVASVENAIDECVGGQPGEPRTPKPWRALMRVSMEVMREASARHRRAERRGEYFRARLAEGRTVRPHNPSGLVQGPNEAAGDFVRRANRESKKRAYAAQNAAHGHQVRPYEHLVGWSDEERRERRKEQYRESKQRCRARQEAHRQTEPESAGQDSGA